VTLGNTERSTVLPCLDLSIHGQYFTHDVCVYIYIYMFMIYLSITFHIRNPNSLLTTVKPKVKDDFHMSKIFLALYEYMT